MAAPGAWVPPVIAHLAMARAVAPTPTGPSRLLPATWWPLPQDLVTACFSNPTAAFGQRELLMAAGWEILIGRSKLYRATLWRLPRDNITTCFSSPTAAFGRWG